MTIVRRFKSVISLIKAYYPIIKYDSYTIAEYLRKQGAQIGTDCFISVRNLGGEPFLVKIGNHVAIAAGVRFLTHNLGWIYRDRIPDLQMFGTIEIEDNCNIGAYAILLANVTIGQNSIVGAGSVVNKNIPPNSIAAGVPARVIGDTREYFQKAKEIWEKQKPKGYMAEFEPEHYYAPSYMHQVRAKPINKDLLRKHLTKLFWGEER